MPRLFHGRRVCIFAVPRPLDLVLPDSVFLLVVI